jgi:antitoxin CptB
MSELSRLRWRCRRGIKEMDIILQSFLDQTYPELSNNKKIIFENLLEETDLDILDWILQRSQPENKDYQSLITQFRELKPDNSQ